MGPTNGPQYTLRKKEGGGEGQKEIDLFIGKTDYHSPLKIIIQRKTRYPISYIQEIKVNYQSHIIGATESSRDFLH